MLLTPKRYDEHPRPFHMGVPPPPCVSWVNWLSRVKAGLHVRRKHKHKHKHKPRVWTGTTTQATSNSARSFFLRLWLASFRFTRWLCLCLCLCLRRTCKPAFSVTHATSFHRPHVGATDWRGVCHLSSPGGWRGETGAKSDKPDPDVAL